MSSFDISYLAGGGLPVGMCPQCYALYRRNDIIKIIENAKAKASKQIKCNCCQITFEDSELHLNSKKFIFDKFLTEHIIKKISLSKQEYKDYQLSQLIKLGIVKKSLIFIINIFQNFGVVIS